MELDKTVIWNHQTIRRSRLNLPSGKPSIMLNIPELYDTESMLTNVDQELGPVLNLCTFRTAIPCDQDMSDLCVEIMNENNVQYPTTSDEGIDLYFLLREAIRNLLTI